MKAAYVVSIIAIMIIAGAAFFMTAGEPEKESTGAVVETPSEQKQAATETQVESIPGTAAEHEAVNPTPPLNNSAIAAAEVEAPKPTTAELLERLRLETDPQTLIKLWQQLRQNEDVTANPEVAQVAIELMAGNSQESQHVGYSLLSYTETVTPALMEDLKYMANQSGDPGVRIAALSVFGDWMEKHPEHRQAILESTLDVAANDADHRVRGAAVQMMVFDDLEPSDETVATMSRLLISDESATNRTLAAKGFGNVTDEVWKPFLVDQLKTAFAAESEASVKRELIESMMQLNPDETRSFVKDLEPESDPELQAQIEGIQAEE